MKREASGIRRCQRSAGIATLNSIAWAAVALAGCAGAPGSSVANGATSSGPSILYRSGDGRDAIKCTYIAVANDICSTLGWVGTGFADCSDENHRCVLDGHNVMAVPKAGLTLGQQYAVFGAALTVERCFGDEGSCDVAMISSVCSSDAVCSCRRADIGKTKVLFYFTRELGVTTFHSAPAASPDELARQGEDAARLADAAPLRAFVLTADRGFLAAPLNMRKARPRENCED